MTVCTQERSMRISTDLNSGCLQRMGGGYLKRREDFNTYNFALLNLIFTNIFSFLIGPLVTALD